MNEPDWLIQKGKDMEKYVRTQSGDFWVLKENRYKKPNCANFLVGTESCITDRSDSILKLVKKGDLIKNKGKIIEVVNPKEEVNENTTEIYVKKIHNYELQAISICDEWEIL